MARLDAIERLVTLLAKLPGIGKKTAGRLAYYILDSEQAYAQALAGELSRLHESLSHCSVCGAWTETEPCPVCADETRDKAMLCVVERAQDVRIIEEAREFRGRFHVLGGLIAPLEGVNPSDLSIGKLVARVRNEGITEVILALNPTLEGDTTSLYVQKQLEGSGAVVTRLASGLPVGGDLEYADRLTLSRSFRSRVRF
ncbi:MAG: recombination mediator RecR [Spirochaetaceae bacterium]|jgi:recombination protein RecR|nr:recombination mediator RecR [Spirochaetaceae bacterium]